MTIRLNERIKLFQEDTYLGELGSAYYYPIIEGKTYMFKGVLLCEDKLPVQLLNVMGGGKVNFRVECGDDKRNIKGKATAFECGTNFYNQLDFAITYEPEA